jgi:hypothetical protein
MLSNQCITSPQGQYMLWMAPTGPLFIYDLAHGVGTWGATGTGNNSGATATLQSDGNFVVYSAAGTALWNSGTNGTNATLLNMEDNGQIILYRPVWQSGALQAWGQTPISHPTCDVGTGTGWTGVLNPGQCFVSPNGHFELLLQSDGGLTIYDRSVSPPQPVWSR